MNLAKTYWNIFGELPLHVPVAVNLVCNFFDPTVIFFSCRLVKQLFLPQVLNNITGNHRIHFKLSFKQLSSPTLFFRMRTM